MWTPEAIQKWWYRMGEIFGTRWYEANGPEATNLWEQSLTKWTLNRAAAVIEHYRTCGQSHPPTLSEVVHVGRTIRVPADEQQVPRLTAPARPDRVSNELAKLRDLSKGARRNKFKPGESLVDYQNALRESGMDEKQFEMERLKARGWSEELEASFQQHMRRVNFTGGIS